AARSCPGSEFNWLTHWARPGPDEGNFAFSPAAGLTTELSISVLKMNDNFGATRIITDDPATAFERLCQSSIGPFRVDVAFVRAAEPYAEEDAAAILEVLNPGGALIVSGPTPESLRRVWEPLRNRVPGLTLFDFGEGNFGAAVK